MHYINNNSGIINIIRYEEIKMKCEICGNDYVKSCIRCTRRVATWGVNGAYAIYNLAKENRDIEADELLEFIFRHYIGKVINKREAVSGLKISLKLAGYKGNFIGRIKTPSYDENNYIQHRSRVDGNAYRWRLKKDICTFCDENEDLILHHIVPVAWGGISSDENCITICPKHHRMIHKELKKSLNRMKLLEYIKPYQDEINELAYKSIENI